MADIFTEWNYETEEVIQYRRQGECNQCGDCCLPKIMFQIAHWDAPDDPRDGGETTSQAGVWSEVNEGNERYFFRMTGVGPEANDCDALQGDGRCSDHCDKNRICNSWEYHSSV